MVIHSVIRNQDIFGRCSADRDRGKRRGAADRTRRQLDDSFASTRAGQFAVSEAVVVRVADRIFGQVPFLGLILIPGPYLLIEGKAQFLKERADPVPCVLSPVRKSTTSDELTFGQTWILRPLRWRCHRKGPVGAFEYSTDLTLNERMGGNNLGHCLSAVLPNNELMISGHAAQNPRQCVVGRIVCTAGQSGHRQRFIERASLSQSKNRSTYPWPHRRTPSQHGHRLGRGHGYSLPTMRKSLKSTDK